jgi:Response regulator receiver domain
VVAFVNWHSSLFCSAWLVPYRLSICKLLAHTMGGSIGVESELGKGASFWFCLPAQLPTDMELVESNDDDVGEEIGAQLQVLVVEDNRVNQKLMANMLRRLGHTSDLAENGKEAIEMIERGAYDLVLSELCLC